MIVITVKKICLFVTINCLYYEIQKRKKNEKFPESKSAFFSQLIGQNPNILYLFFIVVKD